MLAITTRLELIGHWIKMRRSLAEFSEPESSFHTRSSADFITITCGFRFSVHTRGRSSGSADRDAHAAVGHHDRPDDEARAVRGEEGDDLGDLRRVRRTTDRGIGAVVGEEATTILHEVIEEVGYDIADTDRVDADAVLDRLERLSTRQLGKGTLR